MGIWGYSIQKKKVDQFLEGGLLYPFAESLLKNSEINEFLVVQVGANLGLDGNLNDPIKKFFLNNLSVKAILIEPMNEYLSIVKKQYSENSNFHYENIALGHAEGSLNLMRFKPGIEYDKKYYDGLATLKENRISELKNRAKNDKTIEYLEEITVPVFTANYIKEKYEIDNLDILQIDTEGFDLIIIKSFFDANVFPTIINFEFTELTKDEFSTCLGLLEKFNYKLIRNGSDILAVLQTCKVLDL